MPLLHCNVSKDAPDASGERRAYSAIATGSITSIPSQSIAQR